MLSDIAHCNELFHTDSGTAFADLSSAAIKRFWTIRSKRFRAFLKRSYYHPADELLRVTWSPGLLKGDIAAAEIYCHRSTWLLDPLRSSIEVDASKGVTRSMPYNFTSPCRNGIQFLESG